MIGKDMDTSMQDLTLTLGHLHPLLAHLLSTAQASVGTSGQTLDALTQSLTQVAQSLENLVGQQEHIQKDLLDQALKELTLRDALAVMDRRISKTTDQMGRLESLLTDLIDELRGPA
jgi:flagellar biosynthesis chaperone FliJ